MYNIKQLTNFDIADLSEEIIGVRKGDDIVVSVVYKIIPLGVLGAPISKMGYCCEPKGINYPIFLTINQVEYKFDLGKTGMFEFQPEQWINVNGDNIERTTNITVTEIKVPKRDLDSDGQEIGNPIHFVLDYAYEV